MRRLFMILALVSFIPAAAHSAAPKGARKKMEKTTVEKATFGAGCFWGVEAAFRQIKGVLSTQAGYTGGRTQNPTYEDVCTDRTGHAEAVEVTYDPSKVRYEDLLNVFWQNHDPTTPNRQGPDVGEQYRSAIFYHSPDQKAVAEDVIAALTKEKIFDDPIVTEVVPAAPFYVAEDYHQEYFARNPTQGYCVAVVNPKVAKFRKLFAEKLKK